MNYSKKILGFKLQTNAGGLEYMHCSALPARVNHTILCITYCIYIIQISFPRCFLKRDRTFNRAQVTNRLRTPKLGLLQCLDLEIKAQHIPCHVTLTKKQAKIGTSDIIVITYLEEMD
jgi:hypothetical protein